jgi:protein TonB
MQFGASAASPVGGGHAATTYLTIIYGLIQKHLHLPGALRIDSEQLRGSIDFGVDGHGEVTQLSVTKPSGSNDLDAAEVEAVREAAPYPTPPMGLPLGFVYNYPDHDHDHDHPH